MLHKNAFTFHTFNRKKLIQNRCPRDHCSYVNFKILPEWIGRLTALTELDLSKNELEEFEVEYCSFHHLSAKEKKKPGLVDSNTKKSFINYFGIKRVGNYDLFSNTYSFFEFLTWNPTCQLLS